MGSTPATVAGIDAIVFRAGYTGGGTGSRSRSPATGRTPWPACCWRRTRSSRRAWAPATPFAWRPGLCLYGHDIDERTTPVEAGLAWTISKRRRAEGGFPGADVILEQIENGPPKKLVGLRPEGRAPAREGAEITTEDGHGGSAR